jgi:hypothetical protein
MPNWLYVLLQVLLIVCLATALARLEWAWAFGLLIVGETALIIARAKTSN